MLEGFQAGLSWQVILRKREAFRHAFLDFDPAKVAKFGEPEIARLLADEGIVRSRAKIEATINGARIYSQIQQEAKKTGEDFSKWLWSFTNNKTIVNRTGIIHTETETSQKISAALKKRGFKFVGPVIVYAWMQAVGIVDDHSPDCYRSKAKR